MIATPLRFSFIAFCLSFATAQASEQYLGTLEYKGGYVDSLVLEVTPPQPMSNIRFYLPPDNDCHKAVVIREAQVEPQFIGERATHPLLWRNAHPISGRKYMFHSSTEGRTDTPISKISISLDGPRYSTCYIPVYKDSPLRASSSGYSSRRERLYSMTIRLKALAARKGSAGVGMYYNITIIQSNLLNAPSFIIPFLQDVEYYVEEQNKYERLLYYYQEQLSR